MRAQHKFQCTSHKILPELISTLNAFVHLDFELPKVPFLNGLLHVCCAIRTFRHNYSPPRVWARFLYIVFMTPSRVTSKCCLVSARFCIPSISADKFFGADLSILSFLLRTELFSLVGGLTIASTIGGLIGGLIAT